MSLYKSVVFILLNGVLEISKQMDGFFVVHLKFPPSTLNNIDSSIFMISMPHQIFFGKVLVKNTKDISIQKIKFFPRFTRRSFRHRSVLVVLHSGVVYTPSMRLLSCRFVDHTCVEQQKTFLLPYHQV